VAEGPLLRAAPKDPPLFFRPTPLSYNSQGYDPQIRQRPWQQVFPPYTLYLKLTQFQFEIYIVTFFIFVV
jgi:hypothetical protein